MVDCQGRLRVQKLLRYQRQFRALFEQKYIK